MHGLLLETGDGVREVALHAVEHLREVTVTHLDHEEQVLEPVYLEHEKSPAIVEMGKKFAQVGPRKGGIFFAWVLDGSTPAERAALGSTIPGPVLADPDQRVRSWLHQERRARLGGLIREAP